MAANKEQRKKNSVISAHTMKLFWKQFTTICFVQYRWREQWLKWLWYFLMFQVRHAYGCFSYPCSICINDLRYPVRLWTNHRALQSESLSTWRLSSNIRLLSHFPLVVKLSPSNTEPSTLFTPSEPMICSFSLHPKHFDPINFHRKLETFFLPFTFETVAKRQKNTHHSKTHQSLASPQPIESDNLLTFNPWTQHKHINNNLSRSRKQHKKGKFQIETLHYAMAWRSFARLSYVAYGER